MTSTAKLYSRKRQPIPYREGDFLPDGAVSLILDHDADVYDFETGEPIVLFRKNVLSTRSVKTAFAKLLPLVRPSFNRGAAAGSLGVSTGERMPVQSIRHEKEIVQSGYSRFSPKLKNGQVSKTSYSRRSLSSILGNFERTVRTPYCRQTAITQEHLADFQMVYPLFREVSDVFRVLLPNRWQAQKDICDKTHPAWILPGTVFSTITANRTWQTALHRDAGDYHPGFGVLSAMQAGDLGGCYFCLPEWDVGVDMRSGDVMLCDVHQLHANTPIHKGQLQAERLSLVFYYRTKMIHCLSPDNELAQALSRQKGDPLYT